MAWMSSLADRAESLLNNIDEKTARVLSNKVQVRNQLYNRYDGTTETNGQQSPRKPTKPSRLAQLSPVRDTTSMPTKKSMVVRPQTRDVTSMRAAQNRHKPITSPTRDPSRIRKEPAYSRSPSPPVLESKRLYNRNPQRFENTVAVLKSEVSSDPGDSFIQKFRRKSLPCSDPDKFSDRLLTLFNENASLKTEVSFMKEEAKMLLDKMRAMEEEAKDRDRSCHELEVKNEGLLQEKMLLSTELDQVSKKLVAAETQSSGCLQSDFAQLAEENKELKEQLQRLAGSSPNPVAQAKLESELRQLRAVNEELQSELDRRKHEMERMRAEWETYQVRVKATLSAKDKELESLKSGQGLENGTSELMLDVDNLRSECEELKETVRKLRTEKKEFEETAEQMQMRISKADTLMSTLKEYLSEERRARNKAETDCETIKKVCANKMAAFAINFKKLQEDTGLAVATLREHLRHKEEELLRCQRRFSMTSVAPSETSALNVAVCDRDVAAEKVHQLTDSLLARQRRVDALTAENNMLKIQMEKLESKHKSEVSALRSNQRSIHLADTDSVTKLKSSKVAASSSLLTTVSMHVAVFLRRYPLFRGFILLYMISLHLWVVVILLTYSPEGQATIHPH